MSDNEDEGDNDDGDSQSCTMPEPHPQRVLEYVFIQAALNTLRTTPIILENIIATRYNQF